MVIMNYDIEVSHVPTAQPAVWKKAVASQSDDAPQLDGGLDSLRSDVPGLYLWSQGPHLSPRQYVGRSATISKQLNPTNNGSI